MPEKICIFKNFVTLVTIVCKCKTDCCVFHDDVVLCLCAIKNTISLFTTTAKVSALFKKNSKKLWILNVVPFVMILCYQFSISFDMQIWEEVKSNLSKSCFQSKLINHSLLSWMVLTLRNMPELVKSQILFFLLKP